MNKKGINEIRKTLDKNNCHIDRMYGCYINEQKEKIAEIKDSFYSLEEEDLFKYCEIFKKALSGKVGRTLFNIDFPLKEEKEGGHQPELHALLKSGLKDQTLTDAFIMKVIESYKNSEKYLILLTHGAYDIPGKASDGTKMTDMSTDVYEFMQMSICPVRLLREGLCYDAEERAFFSRTEDWTVQAPEVGLLYPAFNDRNTDIHAALWYAKNDKCRHEELSEEILGIIPRPGQELEKAVFRELVETALGESCSYDNVSAVNEVLNQVVQSGKEAGRDAMLSCRDIQRIFQSCAESEKDEGKRERLEKALDHFEETYEEITGNKNSLIFAENIAEPKKISIESDNLRFDVQRDAAALIETKVINGQEYFLVPVTDSVSVNGIRIRKA